MTTLKKDILKNLRKYRKLSRQELATLVGCKDRQIRLAIAELRDAGYMIGITQTGGYSINNKTDYKRLIAGYKARVRTESMRVRKLEQLMQIEGQVSV